jgi:hypothetical protein
MLVGAFGRRRRYVREEWGKSFYLAFLYLQLDQGKPQEIFGECSIGVEKVQRYLFKLHESGRLILQLL